MPTKTPGPERVKVTGPGWKKPISISASIFDQVSSAILAALTAQPIKFGELTERVAKLLPEFQGSISWYTITVARELEVQGKILRHPNPVLYSRPTRRKLPARSGARRAEALPTRQSNARSPRTSAA